MKLLAYAAAGIALLVAVSALEVALIPTRIVHFWLHGDAR